MYNNLVKSNIYVKYFDRKNILRIEGRIENSFVGEIKYYNSKGKLNKIENWNIIGYFWVDSLGQKVSDWINPQEEVFQCGKWTYLKNGKVKKEEVYKMINISNKEDIKRARIILFFNKKGNIIKVKTETIESNKGRFDIPIKFSSKHYIPRLTHKN